jgi:hypothetical protein
VEQSLSQLTAFCTTVESRPTDTSKADTWVYPLVQMGPFGVFNDEYATLQLMRDASQHDEILLASGYFNLTDHYLEVILQESLAKYRLLMASPEVRIEKHIFNIFIFFFCKEMFLQIYFMKMVMVLVFMCFYLCGNHVGFYCPCYFYLVLYSF